MSTTTVPNSGSRPAPSAGYRYAYLPSPDIGAAVVASLLRLPQTPALMDPSRLLALAPGPEFTETLRTKLDLIQFQQNIRRNVYGAAADEHTHGQTPAELRGKMRADALNYTASCSSSEPETVQPRREAMQRPAPEEEVGHVRPETKAAPAKKRKPVFESPWDESRPGRCVTLADGRRVCVPADTGTT